MIENQVELVREFMKGCNQWSENDPAFDPDNLSNKEIKEAKLRMIFAVESALQIIQSIVESDVQDQKFDPLFSIIIRHIQKLSNDQFDIDKVALTKSLIDNVYLSMGTSIWLGVPFNTAFSEVHRSNMSKLSWTNEFNVDGKLLPGPQYVPPDLQRIISTEVS